ncbi:MAG: helix-turn-helix domain-containing protein [Roseiflexaceae bacterium]
MQEQSEAIMRDSEVTPEGLPGIEAALSVIGGKWKILILWHLAIRTSRYGELRRQIPGITEKVLIQQLRELERDGIIARRAFPTVPPHVEYSFSDYGMSLKPVLCLMRSWGTHHLAAHAPEECPVQPTNM